MRPFPDQARAAVEGVVTLLAAGDYDRLVARCSASRLSADGLRETIRAYGAHVMKPPASAYDTIDAVSVTGRNGSWSVRMPLWTAEEGRSDLTLDLTVTIAADAVCVELDDLHVL